MPEITLTPSQYILLGAALGALLGFLLGLIPLFVGIGKKQKKLGVWGLIASTVAGLLSGIVSLIVVAVFLVLIIKKAAPVQSDTEAPEESAGSQDQ